jgi:hypothetical protein
LSFCGKPSGFAGVLPAHQLSIVYAVDVKEINNALRRWWKSRENSLVDCLATFRNDNSCLIINRISKTNRRWQ